MRPVLVSRGEAIVETAAGDDKDDAQQDQYRPDQHQILYAQFACVHPAPDESPEAADQAKDSLKRAGVLK
jgi:hypothetical protein